MNLSDIMAAGAVPQGVAKLLLKKVFLHVLVSFSLGETWLPQVGCCSFSNCSDWLVV